METVSYLVHWKRQLLEILMPSWIEKNIKGTSFRATFRKCQEIVNFIRWASVMQWHDSESRWTISKCKIWFRIHFQIADCLLVTVGTCCLFWSSTEIFIIHSFTDSQQFSMMRYFAIFGRHQNRIGSHSHNYQVLICKKNRGECNTASAEFFSNNKNACNFRW